MKTLILSFGAWILTLGFMAETTFSDEADPTKACICDCVARDCIAVPGYYVKEKGKACSTLDESDCVLGCGNPPSPKRGTLVRCTEAPKPIPTSPINEELLNLILDLLAFD